MFNSSLSPSWQFRDSFLHRRANDEYFVTEYPYLDPDFPAVYAVDRYALYFFHHWRPHPESSRHHRRRFKFLGMQHSILTGYEYEYVPDRYTTTADGGDHFPAPISLITFQETEPPITSFPTARESHFANRNNAVYWQDQISVTEHLKINIGGRYDVYHRTTQSNFFDDAGNTLNRRADGDLRSNRLHLIAPGQSTNFRRACRSTLARRVHSIPSTSFPLQAHH